VQKVGKNMKTLKQKITGKQSRFVDFYLQDLNATKAAIDSGYSHGDYGRQLMMKPVIQEAIKSRQMEIESQTNITVASVIQNLTKLYCEAREKGELGVAARCLELLGRHTGAFARDNRQTQRKVLVNMNFGFNKTLKIPSGGGGE
jgi:phage terminase small subunit